MQTPTLMCLLLAGLLLSCRETTPPSAPVVPAPAIPPPPGLVEEPGLNIQPFPQKFTLAKKDLSRFSGSIQVGNRSIRKQNLVLQPVLSRRFGCYTLGATLKWDGIGVDGCNGGVYDSDGRSFQHGDYVFATFYDESEYWSIVVSVWKVRGDSLDFYTVLNQYFVSDGPDAHWQIDSMREISPSRRRLFGRFSWQDENGERLIYPWSATWFLPDRLEF